MPLLTGVPKFPTNENWPQSVCLQDGHIVDLESMFMLYVVSVLQEEPGGCRGGISAYAAHVMEGSFL